MVYFIMVAFLLTRKIPEELRLLGKILGNKPFCKERWESKVSGDANNRSTISKEEGKYFIWSHYEFRFKFYIHRKLVAKMK